ncbi:MAG: MarR family transcriptional regulator, partial [Gemmatimonadetes bacterium]|nr:MarR family transcriptional regulator [Gemmatimonadota bacterium]NIR78289.1 MarR family transcriptional regulator [Gemmatimonadota bacterium]NIT86875.1 MarR family transcriptional regulator [Gemmatimonadota bacterium]NIU31221.1 MarR family transcriptional regulator [Gemmatimonadota bacterium]NIU35531.1 MarR family transcriptional regulator [Gemmatimonadota bacterium]
EPLPTMEIADRMIEKTPGVTRFLDRLEEEGLVRRERCQDDRRMVHAWISDRGLELLAELDGPVERADRATIKGLSSRQVGRIVEALETVRRNAG